jgi:hypothetical protein
MLSGIPPRLNHGTVVAYLALFVALGGGSYAAVTINGKNIKDKSIAGKKLKNRTITKGKIRKNTLTGTEINESKIGKVLLAAKADTATTAGNALALQGLGAGSFAPADRESIRSVGTPGNPNYEGNWGVSPGDVGAGFFKDPYRVVHLYGQAFRSAGTDVIIFTLPPGYRPEEDLFFPAYGVSSSGGNITPAFIDVEPNGAVGTFGPDVKYVGLSGVSFPVPP